MTPYYSDDAVQIFHGDCREILPHLPKVDLVLTDPPYGIGVDYGTYEDSDDNLAKIITETIPMIIEKGQRTLLTCGVLNISRYPQPKWILAWVIPTTNSGSSSWGFSCWQPILAYGPDPYLESGKGRQMDTITGMATEFGDGKHPCPKPLNIWKKIMLRGSVKDTETILDPFMGSGTTLRAAKDLGRKAIGIEIEEKYCEIAAKRMSQTVMGL